MRANSACPETTITQGQHILHDEWQTGVNPLAECDMDTYTA